MTRFRADMVLLLVAAIWGAAFVAQKTAMDHMGPFGFTGVRFMLSMIVVFPFVLREHRKSPALHVFAWWKMLAVAVVFVLGVMLQQIGLMNTSVTNAGFITGLYVLFTPFAAWVLFRIRPGAFIWPACLILVAGLWFLNGGSFSALTQGDVVTLFCAIAFGGHVALMGWFLNDFSRPLLLVFIQYFLCVVVGLSGAFLFESLDWDDLSDGLVPVLYGGLVSGGIAYTLQAVAQQYTPPSDAAIIMSAESVFAGAAGVLLLGEVLTASKITGCLLILLSILLVELFCFLKNRT